MEVRPLKKTSKKRTTKHKNGCQCDSASEMCSKLCGGAHASRSCSGRGTK